MNIPFDLTELIQSCPNLVDGISTRCHLNICGHVYEISTELLDAYPDTLLGDSQRRESSHSINHHRHPSIFAYILYYYILGYTQKPSDIPSDVFDEECRYFSIPYQYDEDENFILTFQDIENCDERSSSSFCLFVSLLSCLILFLNQIPKSNWISNQLTYQSVFSNTILNWIEIMCSIWFIIEMFFFSSTNSNFFLFIDLISIMPILISLLIDTLARSFPYLTLFYPLYICLKSFRLFRLIRYLPKLNLIITTITFSIHIFTIPFILCSIFIILFGIHIYLFERTNPSSAIADPNRALAWAFETVTTIGFGEHIPRTYPGRCLSIFACLSGVIVLALPIPMLFQRFQILYQNSLKRDLWRKYI